MLLPKKTKFRKRFRGSIKGRAWRGGEISFGEYGLKAMAKGDISSRQIEAARKVIRGYTERGGKLWIRIFPDKPITKKPPETRMGGGKGDTFDYVAVVKPGRMLFEMAGVSKEMAREAMRMASAKMSVRTKFVEKQ